jgi:hypothetical protein
MEEEKISPRLNKKTTPENQQWITDEKPAPSMPLSLV